MSDADAAAMAEMLSEEHPQIVAAALSRLGEEQSAAVFATLPPSLQSETLVRLASLAPVDEEAVHEVQSQLRQRLQQRRDREARSAASAELVRRILARTPPAQRTYLLERLAGKDIPAPRRGTDASGTAAPADPMATQAQNLATAVRRARAADRQPTAPRTDSAWRAARQTPLRFDVALLADRSDELETLDDATLVAALRRADEATVLRALAASGEEFLKRVTNMLPARQARKLRRMLRALGPTRLADLHHAQHELLRLAHGANAADAA
jgi:flagellar motor switch protein FliG